MIELPFENRTEAGKLLAAELAGRNIGRNCIVLALPSSGVPVGLEVAEALEAPLDVVVVRKLGVPWQPELAMGAVGGNGVQVLSRDLIEEFDISPLEVDAAVARERSELARREKLYRSGRGAPRLEGRTVVLVDDGLATGSTMLVAARYVRAFRPAKIIVAVPVGSMEGCEMVNNEADDLVCLSTPPFFMTVGEWFADYREMKDWEVRSVLDCSHCLPAIA